MVILSVANDILVDFEGNLAYLTDDKLYTFDSSDELIVGASLTSNNSDLGEPGVDKLINFVDADYSGAFNITFYFDNSASYTMTFPNSASRTTKWTDFPLSKRRAFQKLKIMITTSTPNTIINGLEIDFSVMARRRYN